MYIDIYIYTHIKARNLCVCVCVCVCVPQISQTEMRFSTWLLCGLRVCSIGFVWTTSIYCVNTVCQNEKEITIQSHM